MLEQGEPPLDPPLGSDQWRIQDFPDWGRQPDNCVKMKNFWSRDHRSGLYSDSYSGSKKCLLFLR